MPRSAVWYFDVISPYVYLQLADLGRLPADIAIDPKPVLFAGLLGHWGQKGPAEIPGKRLHTYRQCAWLAETRGIPFRMPPAHPFNPLAALRLLCALGPTLEQARIASAFVFGEGRDPSTPEGLSTLGLALGVQDAEGLASHESAKATLRANTEEAVAAGVWGVPSFAVGGQLFWGCDSFPMMLDFLADPKLFENAEMQRHATLPTGATRRVR
jgi:2-hydroxychromene-2-carboxylate isomerase